MGRMCGLSWMACGQEGSDRQYHGPSCTGSGAGDCGGMFGDFQEGGDDGGSGVSFIDDDWELPGFSNDVSTIVLVGRTGNGKSATGNSIIGQKSFKSRASSSGVASTCESQRAVLKDGRLMNVIDTPGLFDFSAGSDFIGKELLKCINLAKDGIHAILLVFSVRTHFSKEEEAALRSSQTFFGEKIINYMIMVFTGEDELEDSDETLEDYLGRECSETLKKVLQLCKNRKVLFDK